MDIRQYLQQHRERILAACVEILKFKTVSGAGDPAGQETYRSEIKRCLNFLHRLSAELGMAFRNYDDRVAVIEHKGADRPVMGIPTHIDVVPTGENWTHPPFGGVIDEQGVLWGRGTLDDKIPLIECLFGLWAAANLAPGFPYCCRIIVGTQEETGDWSDMEYFKQKEGPFDFGFTPDADFPIINGEKGFYNPHIMFRWNPADFDPALPGLPARFLWARSGERANVVPDLAEILIECDAADRSAVAQTLMSRSNQFLLTRPEVKMTIEPQTRNGDGPCRIRISFIGKRAHSSTPWAGHNAAVDAMNFMAAMDCFPAPAVKTANFLYHRHKDMFASGWNAAFEDSYTGKNTVNLGVVELTPQGAKAIVNFRPPLGLSVESLRSKVAGLCATASTQLGLQVAVEEPTRSLDALFVAPNAHPGFFSAMQRAYRDVVGETAELRAIGGTTYAKAFPNTVSFGPILSDHGEPPLIHQVDERVTLDAVFRNTEIYGRTMLYLAEQLSGSAG
ncbi:MAG: dipeptidase PepV [Candidatus Sumerlaeia bacterium]